NDSIEPATRGLFGAMEQRDVRILSCPGPFNYSKINNDAVRHTHGEIILLLNNDISIIEPGWLKEMVCYFAEPDVGAVGAKLLYPDGTLQHGGVVLGMGGVAAHIGLGTPGQSLGYFGQLGLAKDVSCVTGACLAVRRSVFDEIGGFDEQNLP